MFKLYCSVSLLNSSCGSIEFLGLCKLQGNWQNLEHCQAIKNYVVALALEITKLHREGQKLT